MTEQQIRQLIREELKALLSNMFQPEPPAVTHLEPVTKSINNITTSVSATLNRMGVPANIKGYKFLREGITEVCRDESMVESMANLYKLIAHQYSTTESKVERAMRHAIEVWYDKNWNKTDLFEEKPANGLFIATISNKLKMDLGLSFR